MNDAEPAQTPDTESPPAVPPSPGALLRQARERAGLAADELAAQIKLARGTLDALERDDFAALSEPVYVRGYYRKIAKVLPVSEVELLAAYNPRAGAPRAKPAARMTLAGTVDAPVRRRSPALGIGIATVIVVAAAVRWVADKSAPRRQAPAPAVITSPAVPPAGDVVAPAEQAPVTDAAPMPAPGSAPATSDAAAPAGRLILQFSDSSFVRVEDARNKTLAIGLVRAGETQALTGEPPYGVFLGNARNVKVLYDGQPVDFSAHINSQNDTARFTVP